MGIITHQSNGQAPLANSSRAGRRLLLRRLMIACPATGIPTDTGVELSAIPLAAERSHRLVDCMECGQDHQWTIEEAVLE